WKNEVAAPAAMTTRPRSWVQFCRSRPAPVPLPLALEVLLEVVVSSRFTITQLIRHGALCSPSKPIARGALILTACDCERVAAPNARDLCPDALGRVSSRRWPTLVRTVATRPQDRPGRKAGPRGC